MDTILIIAVVCMSYAIAVRAAEDSGSPLVGAMGLFLVLFEFVLTIIIAVK